ncbi:hypothetical protein M5K25_000653 [Dendrobium thyrsiflorum]|uniref:Uncharacterized protein n=1 Tax=Dendrobium thyrsiflorum TaxID=117978 RepID=A0ABD0VU41_DENTH
MSLVKGMLNTVGLGFQMKEEWAGYSGFGLGLFEGLSGLQVGKEMGGSARSWLRAEQVERALADGYGFVGAEYSSPIEDPIVSCIYLHTVHEKIDGKFVIMEEMMKLLEGQTKTAPSEAREAAFLFPIFVFSFADFTKSVSTSYQSLVEKYKVCQRMNTKKCMHEELTMDEVQFKDRPSKNNQKTAVESFTHQLDNKQDGGNCLDSSYSVLDSDWMTFGGWAAGKCGLDSPKKELYEAPVVVPEAGQQSEALSQTWTAIRMAGQQGFEQKFVGAASRHHPENMDSHCESLDSSFLLLKLLDSTLLWTAIWQPRKHLAALHTYPIDGRIGHQGYCRLSVLHLLRFLEKPF